MATSVIEICNNALLDLGEDTITALTDNSRAARLCNQRWPAVRDAVLRAHPWNCCMAQAELAAAGSAPLWRWDWQYPLPADFLRVVLLTNALQRSITEWEVQGRHAYCDEPAPLFLAYVRRETDPQKYDALLSEALSARLAATLAYPLSGSSSLAEGFWKLYQEKILEARGVDAREGVAESVVTGAGWLSAKYGA
ncbi:MAG: hypothetical protein AB7D57_11830 [Desulfovibrionaceae bacterium]